MLMILTLGIYRSIDMITSHLMLTPDAIGLFLLRYGSVAWFLTSSKIRITWLLVTLLGGQVLYGSSMGILSSNSRMYKIRHALAYPLAIVGVFGVMMMIWAGSSFWSGGLLGWVANTFSHPLIRDLIQRLPGILTGWLLLGLAGTTTFARPFGISFNIYRKRTTREKDAIYIEHDEPIRHVVE